MSNGTKYFRSTVYIVTIDPSVHLYFSDFADRVIYCEDQIKIYDTKKTNT